MLKHTPAPWTNDNGLVYGLDSRPKYIGTPSIDIFDAHGWPVELYGEAMANACLIAAAPDLLLACEQARDLLVPTLTEPGRTVFWELVKVINKALGK